jgi:rhodanese-related sulfurtransferase
VAPGGSQGEEKTMPPFASLLVATLTLAPPALPPPGVVSGAAAQSIAAAGAVIVDVRTPSEFEAGHAKGAVNIPFDQIAARAGELPKDRPVVLYCRTGRRSGIAAGELSKLGFKAIYDFQSLSAWPGEVATGK